MTVTLVGGPDDGRTVNLEPGATRYHVTQGPDSGHYLVADDGVEAVWQGWGTDNNEETTT